MEISKIGMRWVIPEGTSVDDPVLQFCVYIDDDQGGYEIQDWTTVKRHCVPRRDFAALKQTGSLPPPPKEGR